MERSFGTTRAGDPVRLVTLVNDVLEVRLLDRGATIQSLLVPDHAGRRADVVLGFDTLEEYESEENPYLGATIGRVANRIANGSFELDGKVYELERNEPPHHLHGGGARAFDKMVWAIDRVEQDAVTFSHVSPDGDEGYPGRVEASVTYRLIADALRVEYRAVTDQTTPINLTNHTYYNLAGAGSGDVLDHELQVMADAYTPTDDGLIPTGAVAEVAATPLDFRVPTRLGARIGEVLGSAALGYDHNFVLRGHRGQPAVAARLRDPASGRVLELTTDQPALQVYAGNRLHDLTGKDGAVYGANAGVCLEPQHHPDAVHHPEFPSILVEPGQVYEYTTLLRFPGLVSDPDAAS